MEETTIKRRPRKGQSPQKNRSKQGVMLAVMLAAVTLLFVLAYIPWYLKDRKAKKTPCV